jgi:hypothetical protein
MHQQYGGYLPPQPQQPLNVSVGPRSFPPSNDGKPNSQQQQPPSFPQTVNEELAALKAELSLKNALIDQYRAKTKTLKLGVEDPGSQNGTVGAPLTPLSPAPASSPVGKSAPARPQRQSGSLRSLLEVQQPDAPETANAATPRGADVGIQNVVALIDAFCQTDDTDSSPSAGVRLPRLDGSHSQQSTPFIVDLLTNTVADAYLSSSAVLDTVNRLNLSRPLNVNVFVSPTAVNNGSFAGLPAAMTSLNESAGLTNGLANTLPAPKTGSWADEPSDFLSASQTLPVTRGSTAALQSALSTSNKGRGDTHSTRTYENGRGKNGAKGKGH